MQAGFTSQFRLAVFWVLCFGLSCVSLSFVATCTPRGFGEHAAGGIEHGPPQAKARRRRQGAGAEPLLRGGWDGEHSKAQAHKTRSRQTSLPAAAASEECSSADSSTGIRA